MRSFTCQCGGDLYFQSTLCLKCQRSVGMCPVCLMVSPDVADGDIRRCGNPACSARIRGCRRREDRSWCNRWVDLDESAVIGDGIAPLCIDCRLTTHLPDLRNLQNSEWLTRMEIAKQRTLYTLRIIGLPIGGPGDPLPLSFRFLLDTKEIVQTGHENGVITVNLREADPVQREAERVRFGEPQRTLIGHMRHELGHYYWQMLVQNDRQRLQSFREVFGDEYQPDYNTALAAYYNGSLPNNWAATHVSAYATMHAWEDFAETFNAYLDMHAVLATAEHFGIRKKLTIDNAPAAPFDRMMRSYMITGLVANELNRDLGLPDLVPEVFTNTVRQKLRWIDSLVRDHAVARRLPKQTPLMSVPAGKKV